MQSKFDNNRWVYQVFCHEGGKEYFDGFPPDSCDYCGSSDLSVAKGGQRTARTSGQRTSLGK